MSKSKYEPIKFPAFELTYKNGELQKIKVLTADKVCFDGLKHLIEFYESELNHSLFAQHLS